MKKDQSKDKFNWPFFIFWFILGPIYIGCLTVGIIWLFKELW